MKGTIRFLILILTLLEPLQAQPAETWIDKLDGLVAREMVDKELPSFALAVVDRDGIVAEIARGRRTLEGGEPVTPSTLFRTGSVGKTLTDLAVMVAREQGKVDLDADVRVYLPDFRPDNPFGTPITLRHLMTHVAGLVREPPVGSYFDADSPSLRETVASLNGTSLLWQPGTHTKYSNAGLAVVGRVLEAVYGRGYGEVLGDLVFRPAGMTTARVGFGPEIDSKLARGVMWQPGGKRWQAPVFNLGMSPAGDHYASVRDMAALMKFLLTRRESLAEMWTPYPAREEWQIEVGLGFSLDGKFADRYRMARNGGAVYGYATELALLPEEGLGVYAVASRDLMNGTVQAIAHWALRAALAARRGESAPEYELTPEPFASLPSKLAACSAEAGEAGLDRYLGHYGWDHNPLVVCRKDGKLHVLIEWFFLYPLTETAAGVFTFPSWALYGHEQLRFVVEDGHVAAAVVGHGASGVRFPRLSGSRLQTSYASERAIYSTLTPPIPGTDKLPVPGGRTRGLRPRARR